MCVCVCVCVVMMFNLTVTTFSESNIGKFVDLYIKNGI